MVNGQVSGPLSVVSCQLSTVISKRSVVVVSTEVLTTDY